jgi:hypothetical protein
VLVLKVLVVILVAAGATGGCLSAIGETFKGDRWLQVQQVAAGAIGWRAFREVPMLKVPTLKVLMREVSMREVPMRKVPMLRVPTLKVLMREVLMIERFHWHWMWAL